MRSSAQHGIAALAQQVLHKLKQQPPLNPFLQGLPPTDAAAAAAKRADDIADHWREAEAALDMLNPEADEEALLAGANDVIGPPILPDRKYSWQYWDDSLSAMLAGKGVYHEVLADARLIGMHNPHVPQQALETAVLAAFGLSRANNRQLPAPAVLLMAVRHEHYHEGITADGADGCGGLHAALRRLSQLARELRVPLGLAAQAWGYGAWRVGYKFLCLCVKLNFRSFKPCYITQSS
jgi:hypothetical protein